MLPLFSRDGINPIAEKWLLNAGPDVNVLKYIIKRNDINKLRQFTSHRPTGMHAALFATSIPKSFLSTGNPKSFP
jgi:mevalonate pyrophosphate decarboxylase